MDDDEMNSTLGLLKALSSVKNLDPKDKLPCISVKDIKKTLNANKDKLIIILFIDSTSPLINLFHTKLSPFAKESRMALAYYVDISKEPSAAQDYQVKIATTILFKNSKELERFPGMLDEEALTYIKDHIPIDPFGGGGHKITQMDQGDYEEYLKSVRRPKPEAPPPQPKKPKHSKYDDIVLPNLPTQQPPSSQPPIQVNQAPQPPTIPFINPFTDDYKELKQNLIDISFSEDEIIDSFIAGCGEVNECAEYIENVRKNSPNNQKLTYPGFNIDDLLPEQREIYDCNNVDLDRLEMLYVFLYTGTTDEDDLIDFISQAQDGQSLPFKKPAQSPQVDSVDAELMRLLNQQGIQQPQQPNNFSRTAPTSDFQDFQKIAQKEIKKEMEEARKKRNDELLYRQQTRQAIRDQRLNSQRERESQAKKDQLSKTAPISPVKSSSPKPQDANKKVVIRFRLPNGSNAQYEFEPTDTFEAVENKLRENNHINETDIIEFNVMPAPRIWRKDFGLQLQEKNVRGRVMMSIIVLPPQEAPDSQ